MLSVEKCLLPPVLYQEKTCCALYLWQGWEAYKHSHGLCRWDRQRGKLGPFHVNRFINFPQLEFPFPWRNGALCPRFQNWSKTQECHSNQGFLSPFLESWRWFSLPTESRAVITPFLGTLDDLENAASQGIPEDAEISVRHACTLKLPQLTLQLVRALKQNFSQVQNHVGWGQNFSCHLSVSWRSESCKVRAVAYCTRTPLHGGISQERRSRARRCERLLSRGCVGMRTAQPRRGRPPEE